MVSGSKILITSVNLALELTPSLLSSLQRTNLAFLVEWRSHWKDYTPYSNSTEFFKISREFARITPNLWSEVLEVLSIVDLILTTSSAVFLCINQVKVLTKVSIGIEARLRNRKLLGSRHFNSSGRFLGDD